MRIKLFILTLLFLSFRAGSALAGDPPALINPTNNSIVSSSKLQWQTPSYPVCSSRNAYRIQVDDTSTFPGSGIYRDTYTDNTYYTPQLTLGTWYWRVMARDETCDNWSNWSDIWSFTLTAATPSPTPTTIPTPIPTPSPISNPTPKPTAKPSPTVTPTPTHAPAPAVNHSPTPKPSISSSAVSQTISSNQSEGLSFTWARRIASSAYRIASVAGATTSATEPAKVSIKNQKQTNPVVWAGFIFILIGASLIGYIYLKKNAKNHL